MTGTCRPLEVGTIITMAPPCRSMAPSAFNTLVRRKQSVNSLAAIGSPSLCAQYIQGSRAVLNESLRILADSRSSSPPSGGNKIKARLNNSDRVYRVVMVSGKRRCL